MVLQLDFDVGKRDDGKVHVHAAVAQFYYLGGESRVCFSILQSPASFIRRKNSVSANKNNSCPVNFEILHSVFGMRT